MPPFYPQEADVTQAYSILFEGGVKGPPTSRFGQAFAYWTNRDDLVRRLGLRPFSDFSSLTPADVEEFGESLGVDLTTWREQWFSPSDALPTVRGVLDHFEADPTWFQREVAFGRPCYLVSQLVDELESLEETLFWAKAHGVRFHLR